MTNLHSVFAVCSRLVVGALLSVIPADVRAEWLFDVDVGATYDDNLTRAQQRIDIRSDSSFSAIATARSLTVFSGFDTFTLGADARGEAYFRYRDLDNIAIGGSAEYRHKFGLGFDAPWFAIGARVAYHEFNDRLREGSRFFARAVFGKRFNAVADAAVGVFVDRRYASNDEPVVPGISGKPFDLRGQGIYATGGYAVTDQLLLTATASVRRGDVVSTTSRGFAIFTASDAIALDPAFGGELYAYRLRGTTRAATIAASWALSNRSSINMDYADERTSSPNDLDYRAHVVNLRFVHQF